jgi:hypothetical protein
LPQLNIELKSITAKVAEREDEHSGEEGVFAEHDKVNKAGHSAFLVAVGVLTIL